MEARLASELPRDPGWQFEPKWDGFRCLVFRHGDAVDLRAKSGKPLGRYFPEVVETVRRLPAEPFVLDGELTIPVGPNLDFDALQMRLHPAESRIRKLSQDTPAILILFDMLVAPGGRDLVAWSLERRRAELEAFWTGLDERAGLRLTPVTRSRQEAEAWLGQLGGALDGIVAKRLDGPYQPGERAMVKVKHMRSADCVVAGFRYQSNGLQVGSLLLGLYDGEGLLHHVGFTSAISDAERPDLTRRLTSLIDAPGFTGRAPGGPSRWSAERSAAWEPLRPELVVEVRYDHVTGDRFRHGTRLLRWRPDKAPRQCGFEQLQQEVRPPEPIACIIGGR